VFGSPRTKAAQIGATGAVSERDGIVPAKAFFASEPPYARYRTFSKAGHSKLTGLHGAGSDMTEHFSPLSRLVAIATSSHAAHVVPPLIAVGERFLTNSHTEEGKMASFETIYRIPSSHVLKTKFHSYGEGVPDSWSHVEYDDGGLFVALYESRARTNYDGGRISDGWKKFDIDGVLVASEDGLLI
jgi:hypothetical protein